MFTPLHNLTVEQLEKAADEYCEKYVPMYRKVVRNAFMEAVLWAQKVNDKKITL